MTARLVSAEVIVALGARHIKEQERLVAELRRDGHVATDAETLLVTFRDAQVQHIAYRDFLLKELKAALGEGL